MAINYIEINSRALNLLLSTEKHITSIDAQLKAMVELRVSQINGCSYCIDLHCEQARSAGVPQQKLDCLSVHRESLMFSDQETCALCWAEIVTDIQIQTDMDEKLNTVLEHFSEQQAVDLTIIISLMNCMNRMAISFGDKPASRMTKKY